MIAGVQRDMVERKTKLDEQRERQERALHEKLSQRKRQQLAELVSGH